MEVKGKKRMLLKSLKQTNSIFIGHWMSSPVTMKKIRIPIVDLSESFLFVSFVMNSNSFVIHQSSHSSLLFKQLNCPLFLHGHLLDWFEALHILLGVSALSVRLDPSCACLCFILLALLIDICKHGTQMQKSSFKISATNSWSNMITVWSLLSAYLFLLLIRISRGTTSQRHRLLLMRHSSRKCAHPLCSIYQCPLLTERYPLNLEVRKNLMDNPRVRRLRLLQNMRDNLLNMTTLLKSGMRDVVMQIDAPFHVSILW